MSRAGRDNSDDGLLIYPDYENRCVQKYSPLIVAMNKAARRVVVNKPAGSRLVVHQAQRYHNTSLTALPGMKIFPLRTCQRPHVGLVHHHAKDTSGLLVMPRAPATDAKTNTNLRTEYCSSSIKPQTPLPRPHLGNVEQDEGTIIIVWGVISRL